MAIRTRHLRRHGRDWRWLWLRCVCGRWWRCRDVVSVLDLPYSLAPAAPALAVPAWLATTVPPPVGTVPATAPGVPEPGAAPSPAHTRSTSNRGPAWDATARRSARRTGRRTPAHATRRTARR